MTAMLLLDIDQPWGDNDPQLFAGPFPHTSSLLILRLCLNALYNVVFLE